MSHETPGALLRRLAFKPSRPHLAIGAVFCLLGLLIAVALVRDNGDEPWRGARTEDLVQILDDLGERRDRLEAESARLTALEADLERGSTAEALAEARRQQEALVVLSGTTAVSGPGVRIVIDDPGGNVDAAVLLDAVQELRDAGAEAIAVGAVRVVVDTWFGDGSEGIVASGEPVGTPLTIEAIGDPDTLAGAVGIPGGLADSVRTRDADFALSTVPEMTISVTVPEG